MQKKRLFIIICMSLILVFVYACNNGSHEDDATEVSTQEHEHELGEHAEEGEETGLQISEVVANCDHFSKLKYSSTLPYAFTVHGAINVPCFSLYS